MSAINHPCYQEDCITGSQSHLADNSIDLIITDPPYGIRGDTLHKHYNRNEAFVLDGYTEVPLDDYARFSHRWITEAARVLKPGGSLYVVSGYTNLVHILAALQEAPLHEQNHIIWKYNFGVYTRRKYVSSHYHILFYTKPGAPHTFNTHCRFGPTEKTPDGSSLNYRDREDVWIINREYKPGSVKNKNELPTALLAKIIGYSSNPGDRVCDFFLGGFSTAITAYGLNREVCGFEINPTAFQHGMQALSRTRRGFLLDDQPSPPDDAPARQGQPWTPHEREQLRQRYSELRRKHTKKEAIDILGQELGRGYFSILNALKTLTPAQDTSSATPSLFQED